MQVEHSVEIKGSVEQLSSALLDSPSRWFPRLVGIHVAGIPVRKRVHILVGEPERTPVGAAISIWWQPTFGRKLLPVMNGRLELAEAGKNKTRLTVGGSYEPPLGRLGEQLDKALMHKVAKGTVKELAMSVAERLERASR